MFGNKYVKNGLSLVFFLTGLSFLFVFDSSVTGAVIGVEDYSILTQIIGICLVLCSLMIFTSDKAYKKVKSQLEDTAVGMDYAESIHQRAIHEAKFGKQGIFNKLRKENMSDDDVFKAASKYARTEEGARSLTELIQENTMDLAGSKLKDVPDWMKGSYLAGFTQNTEELARMAMQKGIVLSYDEAFKNKVAGESLALQQRAQQALLFKSLDNKDIPSILERLGLAAKDNKYEGISKSQVVSLIAQYNDGGSPIGTDLLKNLGLDKKLYLVDKNKDSYK